MKTTLLALAALGGAAAVALPAGYYFEDPAAPRSVPELQDLGPAVVIGPLDGSAGVSLPLQSTRRRDFSDLEQAKAFLLRETLRLQFKHGNFTEAEKRDALNRHQLTDLSDSQRCDR